MNFAEIMNAILADIDRTASWLAKKIEKHPATVMRWCNDENHPGDLQIVIKIIEVLSDEIKLDMDVCRSLVEAAGYDLDEGTGSQITRIISKSGHKELGENTEHSTGSSGEPYQLRFTTTRSFRAVDKFFNRESLINALKQKLKPKAVYAICGPAGIGKTALISEVIFQLEQEKNVKQQQKSELWNRFPDGILHIQPDIFSFDHIDHILEHIIDLFKSPESL